MANGKQYDWLLIGLGNPGKEFEHTWHNIGILFLEHCAQRIGIDWSAEKTFHFIKIPPDSPCLPNGVVLVAPLSFMNESGGPVREATKKFGVEPQHLILAHDDSDLPFGESRLEFGRGHAGHNGIRSVISTLGTQDFWRLRIGIRKSVPEGAPRIPARELVLKEIGTKERGLLQEVFEQARTEVTKKITE